MIHSRVWLKLTFGTKAGEKKTRCHSLIHSTNLGCFYKEAQTEASDKGESKHFRSTIDTGLPHVKYSFTKAGWEIVLQLSEVIER